MPKLLVFSAYAVITVSAFSLSGCIREKTKKIVGFSQTENIGPWRIAETNSIKEEAAKRKQTYDFLMTDAQGQTSKQFSDIEDLIARQVDVIFLAPREYEGLTPALEAARAAKIPVFLIDREAAGRPGEHFVSFLGSDFIAQGRRVGEWLAKASNGKASIVELTGTAGSSVAIDRAKGFRNAIARAISFGARVLILDEPTSSLTETEVSVLFDVMRRLKSEGTSIVYVSHRFEELYAVCDRVTVLRDGRNIVTRSLSTLTRLELVCFMLGRKPEEVSQGVTAFAGHSQNTLDRPVLLQAEALKYKKRLNGVSIEMRYGEIVGIAGLLGSGRSETVRALFGAEPLEGGTVKLEGSLLSLRDPHDAIAAGIAFLSEDRKADGIIPELSVRENLTLAALPNLTQWGIVSRKRQSELVERFMQRLDIKAASAEQKIHELSGGNQQKVLLARWLCKNTKLLLLDEPTRGIDVGAKREIQQLIAELAEQGLGVLMISSEVEELVEGSQRVVVLRDGRSIAELGGEQKNIKAILHAMAEGADRQDGGQSQTEQNPNEEQEA